ncbi:MAG: LPS export ABC transporter periplasmic protein LptC [Paludibacteraceae bacterium]|nr:LPS export ABC transporter periplasmic protein LptC [Paludibacteraceae bacterium]
MTKKKSFRLQHVTIASLVVVTLLFFLFSCSGEKVDTTSFSVENRSKTPKLRTDSITTLVSDSGITRYRLSALQWMIFDRDTHPYWDFPEGIYVERFDEEFNVDAFVQSDKARYDQTTQIWQLDYNVIAQNLEGEKFETEQMFWDQKNEKIYSDSLITITQSNKIIVGYGFESNQNFTRYAIRNPQGIFPVKEEKKE